MAPFPDAALRLSLAVLLIAFSVFGRSLTAQQVTWTASLGAGAGSWRAALSSYWDVRHTHWLQLGVGPRLTRFGGSAKSYRSHDATTAGLPSRLKLAPNAWALNLAASAEVRPIERLAFGANLDLIGVATGPERESSGFKLTPARWSLFRYGDRDHGSLNSEAYASLLFTHIAVRAGVSHFVTGYRAKSNGSARYLRFDTVPFLSLTWTP